MVAGDGHLREYAFDLGGALGVKKKKNVRSSSVAAAFLHTFVDVMHIVGWCLNKAPENT
jgi:hypothetical protein